MRLAVAVAFVAATRALAAAPAVLVRIELQAPSTVVLETSVPVEPIIRRLPGSGDLPPRLYLDLPETTLPGPPSTIPGVGGLRRIRTGQYDRRTTRIVLDLDETTPFSVRTSGRNVIVELSADRLEQPGTDVASSDVPTPAPPAVEPARPEAVAAEKRPAVEPSPPPAAKEPPPPAAAEPEPLASKSSPPSETAPSPPASAKEAPAPQAHPAAPSATPGPLLVARVPLPPLVRLVPVPTSQAPISPASKEPPAPAVEAAAPPPPPEAPPPVAELPSPPPVVAEASPPPVSDPLSPPATQASDMPTPEPPPVVAEGPPSPAAEPPPAVAKVLPPPANTAPVPWTGLPVVVLDAGHGGRDPGAEGVGGVVEKDVVLELARLLAERLPARIPVAVVMTRADDSFISIDRRLSAAPESALFLSLHANACSDSSARGVEIFYGGGGVRQASTDATNRRAALLGWCIREALSGRVGPVRGAPRPGDFRVLTQNPVPSALVEIGYLTHPAEAEQARDASYQARLADALIEGIAAFLRASAPPPL